MRLYLIENVAAMNIRDMRTFLLICNQLLVLKRLGSAGSFSAVTFSTGAVLFQRVCLRVQSDKKSMRNGVVLIDSCQFEVTGDKVMMFLFAYRQLLGWVMRCFNTDILTNTYTQKHCSLNTHIHTQRHMHNTYNTHDTVAQSDTHLMD